MTNTELSVNIKQQITALEAIKSELQDDVQISVISQSIAIFQSTLLHLDSLLGLPISVRCCNVLMRNGIDTISKLVSMHPSKLSSLEGMTDEMLREIVE